MKHAFLIMAHTNWNQLRKLIALLDDADHDIYVHVDKKSTGFTEADFKGITRLSKVYFYQEYKVYWGGYNQVQVELLLLQQARSNCQYDYYHLITGMDLPLKSNKEIHAFFEKHAGIEFIKFKEEQLANDPEISRRTRLYHFLQNYRRRYRYPLLNEFFTFCERVLLVCQIILRVNRVKTLDWTIKYGSALYSITDDLVEAILDQQDKIEHVFQYTNCADELFVQTIAYNYGFSNRVYVPTAGQAQNLRHIDFSRGGNGNPYIWRSTDYNELSNSENLFARKFSESVDETIIEQIIASL